MLAEYEDPGQEGALGGVQAFTRAHKLSVNEARKILESSLAYTLHKPRRRRFATVPTLVFGPHEQWQMDLVDVQPLARYNKGYKYWLTTIDVFTKQAFAVPIKNKGWKEMIRALKHTVHHFHTHEPLRVQTDKGTEFYNGHVQAWFKKKGWYHFSTQGDSKASVVERWHRTIKEKLFRYFTAANTLRYVDALPRLINTYNLTYHKSVGMPPEKVNVSNADEVWNRLYVKRLSPKKTRKARLRVGDCVRLNKRHRPFKKGYLPGWTEEIFKISKVRRSAVPTYRVTELDGTPVKGTFYEEDLQRVRVSDESLFRIEKVLKRKKDAVLVRWKGWPAKYDSWIAK